MALTVPPSPKREHRRDRGGVVVDGERDLGDLHRRAGRQLRADGDRHDRRVLGAVGRLERDDARAVGDRPVVEDVGDEVGPGIVLRRGLRVGDARAEQREASRGDQGLQHRRCLRRFSSFGYRHRPHAPQLQNAGSLPFQLGEGGGDVPRVEVVEQLPACPLLLRRPSPARPRSSRLRRSARERRRRRRRDSGARGAAQSGQGADAGPCPGTTRAAGIFSSASIAASQPRMLPSSAGMWSMKTRSPANSVPVVSSKTVRSLSVCAAGQARSGAFVRRDRASARRPPEASAARSSPRPRAPRRAAAGSPRCSAPRSRPAPPAAAPSRQRSERAHEGGVPENVVGVHVGVDDVADRLVGLCMHGGGKRLSLRDAAAGVDHRHRARRRR